MNTEKDSHGANYGVGKWTIKNKYHWEWKYQYIKCICMCVCGRAPNGFVYNFKCFEMCRLKSQRNFNTFLILQHTLVMQFVEITWKPMQSVIKCWENGKNQINRCASHILTLQLVLCNSRVNFDLENSCSCVHSKSFEPFYV